MRRAPTALGLQWASQLCSGKFFFSGQKNAFLLPGVCYLAFPISEGKLGKAGRVAGG